MCLAWSPVVYHLSSFSVLVVRLSDSSLGRWGSDARIALLYLRASGGGRVGGWGDGAVSTVFGSVDSV